MSDNVTQVTNIFPDTYTDNDPQKILEQIRKTIRNPDILTEIKNKNRKLIEEKHTYIKRVEDFMKL